MRNYETVRRLTFLAASLGGYLVAVAVASFWLYAGQPFQQYGSDVGHVFVAAGQALRAGQPVYVFSDEPYFYAPPITVLFALFSLLPYPVCFSLAFVLNVASLRYLAGGWQRVGYTFFLVPVAFLPWAGTLDLPMAAVIVLAIRRGSVALPVLFGFMKFSPLLAIDPARWRRVAFFVALGCLITVPFLRLWPEWFAQLVRATATPVGPLVPIPFAVRLPIGLLLVATRRPVPRALGAVLCTPAFYWHSTALLLAPIALLLPARERAAGSRPTLAEIGPRLLSAAGRLWGPKTSRQQSLPGASAPNAGPTAPPKRSKPTA